MPLTREGGVTVVSTVAGDVVISAAEPFSLVTAGSEGGELCCGVCGLDLRGSSTHYHGVSTFRIIKHEKYGQPTPRPFTATASIVPLISQEISAISKESGTLLLLSVSVSTSLSSIPPISTSPFVFGIVIPCVSPFVSVVFSCLVALYAYAKNPSSVLHINSLLFEPVAMYLPSGLNDMLHTPESCGNSRNSVGDVVSDALTDHSLITVSISLLDAKIRACEGGSPADWADRIGCHKSCET